MALTEFPIERIAGLPLLGNHTALDFTNTVEVLPSGEVLDIFTSYQHVVAWCIRAGVFDEVTAHHLRQVAASRPAEAERVLEATQVFRSQAIAVWQSVVEHRAPAAEQFAHVNAWLARYAPFRHLAQNGHGCVWQWELGQHELEQPIAALSLATAELLVAERILQVRRCPNCGWFFLDTSRNGKRRWCSMEMCGSKMKSRRQYERRKATADSGSVS